MTQDPAQGAPRPSVRGLVRHALAEAGVWLAEDALSAAREAALARGAAALPGALPDGGGARLQRAAATLGLGSAVLPRVYGFGCQQAEALALLVGAPADRQAEVIRLGALFNLGIALFDCLCDRFPARAGVLLARVTPAWLRQQGEGAGGAAPTGDEGVDALLALIAAFFAGSRRLVGPGAGWAELVGLVLALYQAERAVTRLSRAESAATFAVFRMLHRKSAQPLWVMALLGILARGGAQEGAAAAERGSMPEDALSRGAQRAAPVMAERAATVAEERAALRRQVGQAGAALWIVDDLADLREDWDAGCWSRPLWLLARAGGPPPAEADEAIARLHQRGTLAAEARRLARCLTTLRRGAVSDPRGEALFQVLRVTVNAWVAAMAD